MLEFLHIFLDFIKIFTIIISIFGGMIFVVWLSIWLNDFFIKRRNYSEFKSISITFIITVLLDILIASISVYELQFFGIVNFNL